MIPLPHFLTLTLNLTQIVQFLPDSMTKEMISNFAIIFLFSQLDSNRPIAPAYGDCMPQRHTFELAVYI